MLKGSKFGLRQFSKPRVSFQKAVQCRRAGGYDRKTPARIFLPVGGQMLPRDERFKAARNRFYRSQRVIKLVPQNADQPLPRLSLLFA